MIHYELRHASAASAASAIRQQIFSMMQPDRARHSFRDRYASATRCPKAFHSPFRAFHADSDATADASCSALRRCQSRFIFSHLFDAAMPLMSPLRL
jgi:hypothetical protein